MSEDLAKAHAIAAMPGPTIQPETLPYWEAAAEGRMLLSHCTDCDRAFFYPRRACPFCGSQTVEWRAASGQGEVYSFTVIRRGLPEPQATAYVRLAEGPTILTAIDTTDFAALRVGMPVELRYGTARTGRPFHMFVPA